jgi:hypothetical protein
MTNTAGTEACRYKTGDFEDTPCPFVTFLIFCSIPINPQNSILFTEGNEGNEECATADAVSLN